MTKAENQNEKQRVSEWINLNENAIKYHTAQWETPKRSTVAFASFISNYLKNARQVIDIGAGSGAATAYLAINNKNTNFTAFEYSKELTEIGQTLANKEEISNLEFEHGDLYQLQLQKKFDGCISLQTLSWLPDFEKPLLSIFKSISPKWLALTSLFYEGDISCKIEVDEHTQNRKMFYNVYSIPAVSRFCESHGYKITKTNPFIIDIDINEPKNKDLMATYTRKVLKEHNSEFDRLQFSGPLLMNWYMLIIEKI